MENTKIKQFRTIRIIIVALFGTIFLFFIVPMFTGVFNVGNITGTIICAIMIFCSLFYHSIKNIINALFKNNFAKILIVVFGIAIAIGFATTAILSTLMITATFNTPSVNSTAIVLGCKVNGKKPSLMLSKRLEAALKYLNKHPEVICIVSGGQGNNELISEAEAMYTYLVDHGIDSKRIYKEDKSSNTSENIEFSKKIIEENNLNNNITIITDGFHQLRSSLIAKEHKLIPYSISADTPWYTLPTYYVRELFALVEQIILK